ncbi:cobaltochelatase subunit CobN [Acetobacter farinalis]|uniref:cobaltochelatase subunit CobN n=1 Tax=Acetobacter farinalis TaxID=1260984 RepID=UPI0014094AAC|nr:cobaltochelatase subunit CobN [Acetobacter farinalis]
MHLLVRENRTLDEQDAAEDLGLPSADLVVLSFTESDLLGLLHAQERLKEEAGLTAPSLQVTSLVRLRHPMSVDLYLETTLAQARCVVVRLLGGLDYWRYGAEELAAWCRAHGVPLALLPGEARPQEADTAPQPASAPQADAASAGTADDARLAELSTIPPDIRSRLNGFFQYGGVRNMVAALRLMASIAGKGADEGAQPEPLPRWGLYRAVAGAAVRRTTASGRSIQTRTGGLPPGTALRATLLFYRAHLVVGDIAALEALAEAMAAEGCTVEMLFVTSLKDPAAARGVAERLQQFRPDVVLNATVFSSGSAPEVSGANAPSGSTQGNAPLAVADAPILQVLQPGVTQAMWARSPRGLSRSDLAMQVVLPELDGSIATLPVSFRAEAPPGLPAARVPYEPGIRHTVARALAWARLRHLVPAQRRVGLVLSDYPGAGLAAETGHVAHAVGLDGFASLASILALLRAEGYETGPTPLPGPEKLVALLAHTAPAPLFHVATYRALAAGLDATFMASVTQAWGEPEQDPAVQDGLFHMRVLELGNLTLAVQPDRGQSAERKALYHCPDTPPCHAYVAFYLWLRLVRRLDALVHLGTHGTLEWLPGKAAALSASCAPAVLAGSLPIIYPFIVNNPGEAATARRRLGAVTIGHMTPPVMQAELSPDMQALERLIDEYAEADGLDPRRGALLRKEILEKAARTGVLSESGVRPGEDDDAEALARLDAYLCDVKDLQIRDGLHIFGQIAPKSDCLVQTIFQACTGGTEAAGRQEQAQKASASRMSSAAIENSTHFQDVPCQNKSVSQQEVERRIRQSGSAEAQALLAALSGRFVPPGPAGAPTRGRLDVLPTGRNLFTLDPRALPTPSAMQLAAKMETVLLTRHMQEQGEPLTRLVMDLWGSASLRTGGEDMALALRLMGVEVQRAAGTGHVSGFEIIPLPLLNRPRVDVTLRISGLFRDAFPGQIALFDQVVSAVAARREPPEWNPLAASVRGLEGEARTRATARIFGAAAGTYGTGLEAALQTGAWQDQAALAQAWLEGSAWTYGGGRDGRQDAAALASLLGQAEAVLHVQDHAEADMLESPENAAHEGGLAAAAAAQGGSPALWHGDTSRPDTPRLRSTAQEVARLVRGRLGNPRWIEGLQRHGYAGAAELARGLDALHGFAATLPERFDQQFDRVFAVTLGDEACNAFLLRENPAAREAMRARFAEAWRRGLWHPRGNSVAQVLEDAAPPVLHPAQNQSGDQNQNQTWQNQSAHSAQSRNAPAALAQFALPGVASGVIQSEALVQNPFIAGGVGAGWSAASGLQEISLQNTSPGLQVRGGRA